MYFSLRRSNILKHIKLLNNIVNFILQAHRLLEPRQFRHPGLLFQSQLRDILLNTIYHSAPCHFVAIINIFIIALQLIVALIISFVNSNHVFSCSFFAHFELRQKFLDFGSFESSVSAELFFHVVFIDALFQVLQKMTVDSFVFLLFFFSLSFIQNEFLDYSKLFLAVDHRRLRPPSPHMLVKFRILIRIAPILIRVLFVDGFC